MQKKEVFIPNESILRNILGNIDKEYNLESRLTTYPTYSPEWMEFATGMGLPSKTAAKALFVADFIITSSVLPSGSTDEDRYRSVTNIYLLGQDRCDSTDKLLRMIYLAYKTASEIRSQDVYMGDRGVTRDIALLRLKDAFITPYLWIAADVLGEGPTGWELGILSAALQRAYPDAEIKSFDQAPSHTEAKNLTKFVWDLLNRYQTGHSVQKKETVNVPNFNESQSAFLFDSSKTAYLAAWSHKSQLNLEKIQEELQKLIKVMNKRVGKYQFVSIRGRIGNSSNNLFIVRNPFISSKSMFVLVTPADELNLTKILTLLRFRGEEREAWQEVIDTTMEISPPKEVSPQPAPQVETPFPKTSIPEVTQPKSGFFGRIRRTLLGKKDTPQVVDQEPGPKPVQKKMTRKARKFSSVIAPFSFIAQSLTIDAVSDLDIFELFDTIREANYYIQGAFDSDHLSKKIEYKVHPEFEMESKIAPLLSELKSVVDGFHTVTFSDPQPIEIEEIFMMGEQEAKFIISLNRSEDRAVGTIARTKTIAEENKEEGRGKESVQRRSLHRRTNQFLNALRHSAFIDAIGRIYGQNLDIDAATSGNIEGVLFRQSVDH